MPGGCSTLAIAADILCRCRFLAVAVAVLYRGRFLARLLLRPHITDFLLTYQQALSS